MRGLTCAVCLLGALVSAPEARAEASGGPEGFPGGSTLTGDWRGARERLEARGLTIEAVYTGELVSVASGGRRRENVYLDNVDLILAGEPGSLGGIRGLSFMLYALGNHGRDPSDHAGDLQTASNIEAPSAWRIYEAWAQQALLAGRLSVLGGLYDLNSEFDVIEAAKLFVNSSHGIGPDYAQSGENGPSIFPVTSAGLRLRARPHPALYVQAALLDAVPGDPEDPHGLRVHLGDGALLAWEAGLLTVPTDEGPEASDRHRLRRIGRFETRDHDGLLAVGGWRYTGEFPDVLSREASGEPVQREGNHGLYVLGESLVFRETPAGQQGLWAFFRAGLADSNVNRLDRYAGAGLVYRGLFRGRPWDEIGLAVARARHGGRFLRASARGGQPLERAETSVEATYRARVTGWLFLQPDLQWIVDPGAVPGRGSAFLLGLRAEVSF